MKTKGVLPSNEWLLKNGYQGLIRCMKKHPKKFAHIEQEKEPLQKQKSVSRKNVKKRIYRRI